MPLAFAPFNFFPIAVLSIAALFILWRGITPRRAFLRGWLYGLGMFGGGIYWIHISLNYYGGVGLAAAVALTALLVMFIALYPALLGYSVVKLFPRCNRVRLLLAAPAGWTLLEWVRSWLLSGFPWLSLGYSQIDSPLSGLAPLSGVYGITWAVTFSASLLVYAYLGGKRRALRHALPAFAALWGLAWLLSLVSWSRPVGDPLEVAIVQGSIPQELKWEAAFADEIMDRYLDLSRAHTDADLIVWPETAIFPFLSAPAAELFLQDLKDEHLYSNTSFLLGIREYDESKNAYYNSVINISEAPQRAYRKQHLVPFGEYIPFRKLLGELLKILNVPQFLDFTPGSRGQAPLVAAKQSINVSICYEDVFPAQIRRGVVDSSLLANVSNDAWFGDSIAAHQHLQIARMRALENGRYLLRATNTGISAVIDDKGRVIARTPQFEITTLRARVQPMEAGTPYALTGNFQLFFIMFICLVVGVVLHYYWHPHEQSGWVPPRRVP